MRYIKNPVILLAPVINGVCFLSQAIVALFAKIIQANRAVPKIEFKSVNVSILLFCQ